MTHLLRPLRRLLVPAVAILLFAAACGDDDSTTTTTTGDATTTTTSAAAETTTTEPAGTIELGQECSFEEAGWAITVSFPTEWVANDDVETDTGTVPACRIFDPDDAEPSQGHELTGFGVLLHVDAVDYDEAKAGDPLGADVLDHQDTTVDGRPAFRREDRLTEDGIRGAEGARVTTYIIDLEGSILVARTHEVADLDYEHNRNVLDAMLEALSIERA